MSKIDELFHSEFEGMKLVNVKFFRGDDKFIAQDEFRAMLRASAEFQRDNKHLRTTEAPRSYKQKINVRERVATF